MDERQEAVYDALVELPAQTVVDLLLNYHGTQILDADFRRFLINEGIMSESYADLAEDTANGELPYYGDDPDDGDYVIHAAGEDGAAWGVTVKDGCWADGCEGKVFNSREEVNAAIREDMKARGYWPDVFYINDHGNVSKWFDVDVDLRGGVRLDV